MKIPQTKGSYRCYLPVHGPQQGKGYQQGGEVQDPLAEASLAEAMAEAKKTMAREIADDDRSSKYISRDGKPYKMNQEQQAEEALSISDAVRGLSLASGSKAPRRIGK